MTAYGAGLRISEACSLTVQSLTPVCNLLCMFGEYCFRFSEVLASLASDGAEM